MLNFTNIMIGASDAKKLSDFYKPIFNSEPVWSDEETNWYSYKIGSGVVTVGPHSEVSGTNKEPGRFMLCLEADDPQKEFDRIKGLGTKVVREIEQVGDEDMGGLLGTFEDPEGNYFQIMSSWE